MRFGGLTAIDELSFAAPVRQITSIIGPNGAGKTTLFNCITGFYRPSAGSIVLAHPVRGSLRLETLESHRVAREAQVLRTFQNTRLFPKMTVLENMIVAQHNALQAASFFSLAGLFKLRRYRLAEKQALEQAMSWLQRLKLLEFANIAAGVLPYGTQRRVEIGRAMCADPVLLCLDEPAAGLNPRESAELNDLLLELSRESGISVLLIEHDMNVVMKISDHIVVLNYGRKIAEGAPLLVRKDPHVVKAYLGEEDFQEQRA
ncbi:MAG: ATP-binding cassette domain-containing protein [Betaproteobacteria bacterium]|nr:ATP-binding cassette domain-containing protein [Betaproteobacteria bacterium]